jgi:hypothetical protein
VRVKGGFITVKKTDSVGGLLMFCLLMAEATAATYICDGNTVTDQPWNFQNCVNVVTKQAYADENRIRRRTGTFSAPASVSRTPGGALMATSQEELLKGRQRKRLSEVPSDALAASCLNRWRSLMEEPESPEIASANVDEVRNLDRPAIAPWYEVVLEVKARSSKGEPIEDTFVCGVASTDEADDQTTAVYQTWFKLGLKFNMFKSE